MKRRLFFLIFFLATFAGIVGIRYTRVHADSIIGYSQPNYDGSSSTPMSYGFGLSGASSTFVIDGNSELYTAAWLYDYQSGPCGTGNRFYLNAGGADTNWFYGQNCDGLWYGDNAYHWTKYDYAGPSPCGPPYAYCGSAPSEFGNGEQMTGSTVGYTINGTRYATVIFANASSSYDPNKCSPTYPMVSDCQILPIVAALDVEAYATTGTTITFTGIPESSSTNPLQLQVEVQRASVSFTNSPTVTSTPVASGQVSSVAVSGLSNGSYHFQARAVDTIANTLGAWEPFNASSTADFIVARSLDVASSSVLADSSTTYSIGNSYSGGCCANSLMAPGDFFYHAPLDFTLSQIQVDSTDFSANNHDGAGNVRAWIYDKYGDPIASSTNTVYGESSCAGCAFVFNDPIVPQDFQLGFIVEDGIQGNGGFSFDNVRFDEVIKEVNTKEPVVIVPGVMGTTLDKVSNGEEVWPDVATLLLPGSDSYLDDLALATSGKELPGKAMNASSVIEEELGAPFYKNLLDSFRNAGYVDGVNLFTAPYDWRLDIGTEVTVLRKKILQAEDVSPDGKVDIIAHSMGGLLVKDYLANATDTSFLDKLVFVGVPQLGAPEAFKLLNYGDSLVPFGPIDLLNPQEVKKISQNMPATYELLPSKKYVTVAGGYVQDFRNNKVSGKGKVLSYNETTALMANNGADSRNAKLLRSADTFHAALDVNSVNAKNVYNVVGCQIPSVSGFDIYNNGVINITRSSGDGTVPEVSAMDLANSFHNYFVLGSETEINHAALVADARPVTLITNIITGAASRVALPQGISTSTADCLLSQPTSTFHNETTLAFSTHSPVALSVYDSSGEHTGPLPNGDVELGIPGSTYDTIGENSFITVPASDTYKVVTQALASGNFTLDVQGYRNGVIDESANYLSVPLQSASTTAELDFSGFGPGGDSSGLKVDNNGDGVPDIIVQPGATLSASSSADVTPPMITIQSPAAIDYLASGTLPILVSVTDADSGVGFKEVALDGTATASTSFDLSSLSRGSHTLSVRAIDNAGNPSDASTSFSVVATTDSTIADVGHCFEKGFITKKEVRDEIIAEVRGLIIVVHGKKSLRRDLVQALISELLMWHNKGIIGDKGLRILQQDIQWILDHDSGN